MQLFNTVIALAALILSCSADINGQFGLEKTCIVKPGGNSSIDDAPAITDAFVKCGHNGKVTFLNTTYHVNTVMNTTGLKNCQVDLQGTLLVDLFPSIPLSTTDQTSSGVRISHTG